MTSLKTIGNNIFSRLLIFTLISSFLFFLFDTYQESYDKLKILQYSLEDRQEEILLLQNQNYKDTLTQFMRERNHISAQFVTIPVYERGT